MIAVDIPFLYLYVPGIVLILAGYAIFRWLLSLQHRVNDHAERISFLEAKINGKGRT